MAIRLTEIQRQQIINHLRDQMRLIERNLYWTADAISRCEKQPDTIKIKDLQKHSAGLRAAASLVRSHTDQMCEFLRGEEIPFQWQVELHSE